MNSQRFSSTPHIVAGIGSILILTFLPVLFYFLLMFVTSDGGGPLNLVLIPCSNFIAAALFTAVFFFPLSKLLDSLSQRVRLNGNRNPNSIFLSLILLGLAMGLVIAGFVLGVGIVLEIPVILQVFGIQNIESVTLWWFGFLFLGGVPFLLGGATYWFLLQLSRKLLTNSKGE